MWNFWNIYTNIGGGTLQIIYMVVYAVFFSKENDGVLLAVNMSIEMFLMTSLKIFHFQARPFWAFEDIIPGACYSQFGNPSGHSITAIFFAMYLWQRWFIQIKKEVMHNDAESLVTKTGVEIKTMPIWIQIVSFVILTLGYLAIGYSRFVLGVHSANQILYGFLLGGWSIVMCACWLDPLVSDLIDQIRNKKLTKDQV